MHPEAEPMLKQLPTQAMMMGLKLGKVPAVDHHIEDEGLVLSGDALFAGSVGRTDLPGGSMEVLMRSIEERLLTLPNETRVFPGHGPQTEIGNERTTNPFLQGGLF